ncbi:sugar ABC transporter permease [Agromyces sp. G08B096]|uniref:Sugar ABC transporter permease n=1 Tax=Agromyces sp. G08B096 TaxID=3156399 RepID=A0AAU7W410_9MICO
MTSSSTLESAAAPEVAAAPRVPSPRRRRPRIHTSPPWWFALPAFLMFAAIVAVPTFTGLGVAFTDWSGLGEIEHIVWFQNFIDVFSDKQALGSIRNTLLLTVVIVIVQNVIGLLLALGVHSRVKSRFALRTIFFAPMVVSAVMISFVWKYIYNPRPDAGINGVLGALGLDWLQQDWLGDPEMALWSIAIIVIWQAAGYSMVIFLAGLTGIPEELYEAAMVDGATPMQRFRHITIPQLAPAMTINVLLSLTGALTLFTQVLTTTGGGPGYATETLSTIIYKEAFIYGNFGYSAAIAVLLTIGVSIVAFTQLRIMRRREVD